jgi:hypothetical protein
VRRLLPFLAFVVGETLSAQQPRLHIEDPGPEQPGSILKEAVAAPYLVKYERWNTRLFRDSVFDKTVIVLASDATVASVVHGDVIVVNGDLFLRPGASIDGKAVAIGGGVYSSSQARVRGDLLSFRDAHYDVTMSGDSITLSYRPPATPGEPLLSLPLLYGLRIPSYSRVDGLGAGWGPRLTLMRPGITIDPIVTYRSDIGKFDPSVTIRREDGPGVTLQGYAGIGTFSNDEWIQTDLANSLHVLAFGEDFRNYWRADRFEGRVGYAWERPAGDFAVSAGARTEFDRSIAAGGPWSFSGRHDLDGMYRPNPQVERGWMSSALAGARGEWAWEKISFKGELQVEVPFSAPHDERFVQTTLDFDVTFPTFKTQSLEMRSHLVLTAGDTAPPQRFSYLGGLGTLPTFQTLQFGGDQLVFLDSRYNIPLGWPRVPLLGTPVVMLRHWLGAAGAGSLPRFEHNVGLRISLGPLRVEYAINPRNGGDHLSFGLAIVR